MAILRAWITKPTRITIHPFTVLGKKHMTKLTITIPPERSVWMKETIASLT